MPPSERSVSTDRGRPDVGSASASRLLELVVTAWALPWGCLGLAVAVDLARRSHRVGLPWSETVGIFFANAVVAGVLFGSVLGLISTGFALLLSRAVPRLRLLVGAPGAHLAASGALLVGWVFYRLGARPGAGAAESLALRWSSPLAGVAVLVIALPLLRRLRRIDSVRRPGRWLFRIVAMLLLTVSVAVSAVFVASELGGPRRSGGGDSPVFGFPPLEPPPVRRSGAERLIVVGIDGLWWELVTPLLEEGGAPSFARLRAEGAWGELATVRPTVSPRIWTTVATGRPASEHGIMDFAVTKAPEVGMERVFRPRALPLTRPILETVGEVERRPISVRERRTKALWNVVSESGATVAVAGWWATWPAEPVHGYMISDHAYADALLERLEDGYIDEIGSGSATWPRELAARLRPFGKRLEDAVAADMRGFVDLSVVERARFAEMVAEPDSPLRMMTNGVLKDRYYGRSALRLDRGHRPDVLLAYFSSVDWFGHSILGLTVPDAAELGASAAELRRYGGSMRAVVRWMDGWLARFLARAGDDANLIVLSDHGFEREVREDGSVTFDHGGAPPGLFAAIGPAIRRGVEIDGLHLRDVAPTLFYLAGLPISDELHGELMVEILRPERLEAAPPRRIATYEAGPPNWGDPDASEASDEMLDTLRALGYID